MTSASWYRDMFWVTLFVALCAAGVVWTVPAFTAEYLKPVAFGWCGGIAVCLLVGLLVRRRSSE